MKALTVYVLFLKLVFNLTVATNEGQQKDLCESERNQCPAIPSFLKDEVSSFIRNQDVKKVPSPDCLNIEYFPSRLESYWRTEVNTIVQRVVRGCWHCGCDHVRAAEKKLFHWIEVHKKRDNNLLHEVPWSSEVFSYHKITNICSRKIKNQEIKIPIEPLFGFLRHPYDYCFFAPNMYERKTALRLSKNYLIQRNRNEIPMYERAFMFDLGASTYLRGAGGASQSWFIEQFRKREIYFDRIFAWEAAPMPDESIFETVPAKIVNNLTYFNLPADSTPGAKHNPLRILAEVTRPNDFVVLKIDIDTSAVEIPLIMQIIENSAMYKRVDELYFEHHVSKSPMQWRGWGDTDCGNETLPGSYELFSKLRGLGIRAHSWV